MAKTEVMSIEEQVKAAMAVQQQKAEQLAGGANLISFKGGLLIIDGSPVPNAEVEVFVLAQQAERSYYEGDYDPAKPQVPSCYSFDLEEPHPESPNPQATSCNECPQNKWGSGKRGRGKACRESARVALVPASVPVENGPIYQASFPITSIGTVRDFFTRCASSGKLSGEFKARLKVEPNAQTFFKATLTPLAVVTQPMPELLKRIAQARELLIQPYPVFDQKPVEEKENTKY